MSRSASGFAGALRTGTRRRLRMFAWIVGASIVAGGAYGSLAALVSGGVPREGLIVGVIRGLTLSCVLGGVEVFVIRTRLGRALERAAPGFARDFGVTPGLRAALHGGRVIAGEVGDSKREIVFHGDPMNTASRIEQLTRDLGRRFIVSGDALARLAGVDRYSIEDLGEQTLRGRAAAMRVYAVDHAKASGEGGTCGNFCSSD